MLSISVLTLYPSMFPGPLGGGIIEKARRKGLWSLDVVDLRTFSCDNHQSVDAPAFGGGAGMVMLPQVIDQALRHVSAKHIGPRYVYLSPRGALLTQAWLWSYIEGAEASGSEIKTNETKTQSALGFNDPALALTGGFDPDPQTPNMPAPDETKPPKKEGNPPTRPFKTNQSLSPLILLCGRFEGIDQRVLDVWPFEEISLGDFVLMGGEVAAMALIEALVRLIPGVVGNPCSLREESFQSDLLEYPHYTRPRLWQGHTVPNVLLSGHHKDIALWRHKQQCEITKKTRPDLWKRWTARQKYVRKKDS